LSTISYNFSVNTSTGVDRGEGGDTRPGSFGAFTK
jgi:hypothetical protein